MSESSAEPGFLENIGFVITYKCQIACPHCVLEAGPHRKEEMKNEDVVAWMRQAASYRNGKIKAVCFTGGEPFYDLRKLRQLSMAAVDYGMVPTAVTNAFWAGNMKKALETLDSVPALRVISISTDEHHQAQIPFDRVKFAVQAAQELGVNCRVTVCTEDEDAREYQELLKLLRKVVDDEKIDTVVTFPAGRALIKLDSGKWNMTSEVPRGACAAAHTPVVFPDGRVLACVGPVIDLRCSHPLLLGNLREEPLDRILDAAEMNLVLHVLRVWGPERLLRLLEERGFGGSLPQRFVKNSICNLCYSIMSDSTLVAALADLDRDPELVQKTAYARQYYLDEIHDDISRGMFSNRKDREDLQGS